MVCIGYKPMSYEVHIIWGEKLREELAVKYVGSNGRTCSREIEDEDKNIEHSNWQKH
jgi:hypothetical protein